MEEITQYRFLEQLKQLSWIDGIYLYGSRARGDHRPRSDIDLAISCPQARETEWQKVLEIIETADTLLPIDCLRYDKIDPQSSLYQRIQADKKRLYERV